MDNSLHNVKEELFNTLSIHLQQKIDECSLSVQSTIESRDNDSKSSAGDKHETTRATVQIEIEKLELQLNRLLILQKELSSIQLEKEHSQVELGSLVRTEKENYFLSIGYGKIELGNQIFYAISLASPVGQLLKNKKPGELINFNGREVKILEIA